MTAVEPAWGTGAPRVKKVHFGPRAERNPSASCVKFWSMLVTDKQLRCAVHMKLRTLERDIRS